MNLKQIILFIMLLTVWFIQSCSSSQTLEMSLDAEQRDSLISAANTQIKQLKEGVLLVRLPARTTSVMTLKNLTGERGRISAEELAAINKHLIDSFQTYYTFCPVYFFQSGRSGNILLGNYEGLFLDRNMIPLEQTPEIKGPVFILDVDYIYVRDFSSTLDGMQIRDSGFKILSPPFPYFVRYNLPSFKSGEPKWRTFSEAVQILDQNLKDYYYQATH